MRMNLEDIQELDENDILNESKFEKNFQKPIDKLQTL